MAGAILSILIASTLYGFNWYSFYDTKSNFAKARAVIIAEDIKTLALATKARPGNDHEFLKSLDHYLRDRYQLIVVSRGSEGSGGSGWTKSNKVPVDFSRKLVTSEHILDTKAEPGGKNPIQVHVTVGIRPRFMVALAWAWSFSILDYRKDSQGWWAYALYNRSIPLYGYLFTIILVGFGTIRAIYRDQQELLKLDRETGTLTAELDRLKNHHSEEILVLRKQIDHDRDQRNDAVSHRNKLMDEIRGIEHEYQTLTEAWPKTKPHSQRIKDTKERRSRVEHVLASYNVKVAFYEQELKGSRSELDAAEQLLLEVEHQRQGLNEKLQDRNRQIRKLQGLIQKTQKKIRSAQTDQLLAGMAHIRELQEWEENQGYIEEQLDFWIKTGKQTRVNFASHSKSRQVEEQFQKIDQEFVNRYFSHAGNREYERGSRRLIRVNTNEPMDSASNSGELIIALDDDKGRTLGLRFETRKDAPDLIHIGFVLAVLLRSKCRDFRRFDIRTR